MATPTPTPEPDPAADGLRDLLERARRGDAACLPALREALDRHPELWARAGDLRAHAEQAWIATAAGPDLLLAESLARSVAGLKAELAGPDPTPLERLVVARVAITWLQSSYGDAAAAQARDAPLKLACLARSRQDAAHRGHLAAIAALASLRRLLLTPSPAAASATRPASAGPTLAVFDGGTTAGPAGPAGRRPP